MLTALDKPEGLFSARLTDVKATRQFLFKACKPRYAYHAWALSEDGGKKAVHDRLEAAEEAWKAEHPDEDWSSVRISQTNKIRADEFKALPNAEKKKWRQIASSESMRP